MATRIYLVSSYCNLPDGTYPGLWSSYTITISGQRASFAGGDVLLPTKAGSRTHQPIPVTVHVENATAVAYED